MKSVLIAEFQSSQIANGIYLVLHKDIRSKKGSGDPYLSLVLGDRTGDIEAKMWDNVAPVMETFERDDFVRVKGLPQIFQNRMQFTVHTLQRVSEDEVNPSDFLPASKRDPEEMFAELRGIVAGMANPHLRALLSAIFEDPDIASRYKRAPAAKTIHHAWLGGLLEHVLQLCGLCRVVAPLYPAVDADLVLTGAMLHDIGKIEELSYQRTFNYTDNGQLLGHIVIGLRMVGDKIRQIPDFPPRLRTLVEHLIVSHHGEVEFGSPKTPMLAEAMLLHHLDNLDSKMECMRGAIERDKLVEGNWTTFIPSLDRPVLKKHRFLDNAPPAPRPAAAAPPQAPKRQPESPFAERLKQALSGD
ncbi:MAG: OB-fold nucleic acid binding domain-containing protein [Bryobacteraceae bacterium]